MRLPALIALVALPVACSRAPELETRTFELQYMNAGEAGAMIEPYVYSDRPDAPGRISVSARTVTVRETSDNLDRIERVLSEYDRPQPWVRLHFQIIEANGISGTDTTIAEVEEELRRLFRFAGYRLAGEALITGASHSAVEQQIGEGTNAYHIGVEIGQVRGLGDTGLVELQVRLQSPGWSGLRTQINAREGRTVVLGNAQIRPGRNTTILTVRPELVRN